MSEAHVGYIEVEDAEGRIEPLFRAKLSRSFKVWKDEDDIVVIGPYGDVTLFGAVFDGVQDNATALDEAVDSLPTDGGTIILPPGIGKTTSKFAVDKPNVMIVGQGSHKYSAASPAPTAATILRFTLGSADPAIEITDRNVRLEHFAIEASGGSGTDGVRIYLPSPTATIARFTVRDFSVDGFSRHGLYGTGLENFELDDAYVMDCAGYGIWLEDDATYGGITNAIRRTRVIRCGDATYNAQVFIDGLIGTALERVQCLDANDDYGIKLVGAQQTVLLNCDIERPNTSTGIYVGNSDQVQIINSAGWTLSVFIEFNGQSGNLCTDCRVIGCLAGSTVTTGLKITDYTENLLDAHNEWNATTARSIGTTGVTGLKIVGDAVSSPATLASGRTDNYAIDDEAETVRLTPNAAGSQLSGINMKWAGRRVRLINVGTVALELYHENANSDAEKRFLVPSGNNLILRPNAAADLENDGTTQKVRVVNVYRDSAAYSVSNVTTDRTFDADATTLAELADVVGTIISDLQGAGKLG